MCTVMIRDPGRKSATIAWSREPRPARPAGIGSRGLTLDAVVIGAGPNGLAAAITLARAGRSVRVFEADTAVGGATRSLALSPPGFIHHVCSAVHALVVLSPVLETLPLSAH